MLTAKHIRRMALTIKRQVAAADAATLDGARLQARQALYTVALEFARMAREENERFDRDRFLVACGMGDW